MAWIFDTAWDSGNGVTGPDGNDDVSYMLVGSADDPDDGDASDPLLVAAYAQANLPADYNGRPLTSIQRTRIADYAWVIVPTYGGPESFTETGGKTFSFETGGGTQKITRAKAHRGTYAAGGSGLSTELNGWLNPNKDGGVDGIDLPTGGFDFAVGQYIGPGNMTADYVALLYKLTYTTNGTPFSASIQGLSFTFAAGELLFRGASGSMRSNGDWSLEMRFSAQPNITGKTFGDITGVSAKGWDYISFMTEKTDAEADGSKFIAPKLKLVLVDQVYGEENWTGLLTPST